MNVVADDAPTQPGLAYERRRAEIAARAAGANADPDDIAYTPIEDAVWAQVTDALVPLWRDHAAAPACLGLERLDLDHHRVPQLREVTERLAPFTGFRFEAVPGLVDKREFFAALADDRFLSTQYVRWEGSPLYTPEPDVIHEVFGHAHVLAVPECAALHRLAGRAVGRLSTPAARQFVADVFWFSAEFGVVREGGAWKAYGAGLLSSIGELGWFAANADVLPLDIAAMGTRPYDITRYQPCLFGAGSLDEVRTVVGSFFAECSDDSIAELLAAQPARGSR